MIFPINIVRIVSHFANKYLLGLGVTRFIIINVWHCSRIRHEDVHWVIATSLVVLNTTSILSYAMDHP